MVDFRALRDARPTALDPVADAYDALGRANEAHFQAIGEGVRWIVHGGHWTGSAAEAATTRLERTNGRLDGSHLAMQGMGTLLRDASEAFELARSKLLEALDEAARAGFSVGDDGTVVSPVPSAADRHDPDYDAPRRAAALTGRITGAIAEADSADRQVSALLDRLATKARDGSGFRQGAAAIRLDGIDELGRRLAAAGRPADDASPAQVHAWWQSLTPAEQQRLTTRHPDLIGNRDGIPALARDRANRLMLPRLVDQYRHKPRPLSPGDQQKLDGFELLQKRLNGGLDGGGGPGDNPPLLLLGVSDHGQGRAILCWGDPDTARNVSALVPGLNSTLAGAAGGDTLTARRIHEASDRAQGDSPSTASAVWLGYDAPQLDGGSVMTKDRAVVGAPAYNRFLTGLRSTHEGPDAAHVTAIGHSYGSLLVGQAAQRPGGIAADDVVLVGSPGTGADRASQLSVGADHVYVGSAKWDPVSHLPSAGNAIGTGLGADLYPPLGGFVASRAADPHGLWFGQDPAGSEFGAQRFAVADGSLDDSHDNYFGKGGRGGPSLENIGRIVGGHPDRISRDEGR